MIQIDINKTTAILTTRETLTSGMVKAVKVVFTFSQEWDELTRVAVFSAGSTCVNCVLDAQNSCFVPWECLATAGERLLIGAYGTANGEVVLPSEQCDLGLILAGAALGEDASTEGSPSLAEQMIIKANEAIAIAQSVRNDADNGEFAGETGASGAAATITIGTVTTAASGAEAVITNSGTSSAVVLDFVLPAGAQGETGATGEQGPQGVAGPKGDKGDSDVRLVTLSLPVAGWVGTASPYTQTVAIPDGTVSTRVDLYPDASQLALLQGESYDALVIQNNSGVFTAVSVGGKPSADLSFQACLTEVTLPAEE